MKMTDLNGSAVSPNALQILGILSARLVHSMSNHLAVVTGNLCVAGQMRDDPEKVTAALHAALQAANHAGLLLDRFAGCRKAVQNELGQTSLRELVNLLEAWTGSRAGWSFELDPKWEKKETLCVPLSPSMIAFVFDTIAEETRTGAHVRLACAERFQSTLDSLLHETKPLGLVQITITHPASGGINWEAVRTELPSIRLAAAYEILSQIRARPESRRNQQGGPETRFTLSLASRQETVR